MSIEISKNEDFCYDQFQKDAENEVLVIIYEKPTTISFPWNKIHKKDADNY